MTSNLTDLLAERTKRRRPARHFDDDLEALTFAAGCIDELRDQADEALLIESSRLHLKLDQAAAIVRACMCLHTGRKEDSP